MTTITLTTAHTVLMRDPTGLLSETVVYATDVADARCRARARETDGSCADHVLDVVPGDYGIEDARSHHERMGARLRALRYMPEGCASETGGGPALGRAMQAFRDAPQNAKWYDGGVPGPGCAPAADDAVAVLRATADAVDRALA